MKECNPEECKIRTHSCVVFIDQEDNVEQAKHPSAYDLKKPTCNQACPLGKYYCSRPQGHDGDEHETHSYDEPLIAHARWIEDDKK